jgi:hypothetical protein
LENLNKRKKAAISREKCQEQPKIADRECHGERSAAISIIYKEITAHPSGARNDMIMMTFSLLSVIFGTIER